MFHYLDMLIKLKTPAQLKYFSAWVIVYANAWRNIDYAIIGWIKSPGFSDWAYSIITVKP